MKTLTILLLSISFWLGGCGQSEDADPAEANERMRGRGADRPPDLELVLSPYSNDIQNPTVQIYRDKLAAAGADVSGMSNASLLRGFAQSTKSRGGNIDTFRATYGDRVADDYLNMINAPRYDETWGAGLPPPPFSGWGFLD